MVFYTSTALVTLYFFTLLKMNVFISKQKYFKAYKLYTEINFATEIFLTILNVCFINDIFLKF